MTIIEIVGKNPRPAYEYLYWLYDGSIRFPHIITTFTDDFQKIPEIFIQGGWIQNQIDEIVKLQQDFNVSGLETRPNVLIIDTVEYGKKIQGDVLGLVQCYLSAYDMSKKPDIVIVSDIADEKTYNYLYEKYWKNEYRNKKKFNDFLSSAKGKLIRISDTDQEITDFQTVDKMVLSEPDLWIPELLK